MKFGIIGAMQEEIDLLRNDLEVGREDEIGMRKYWTGKLYGRDVVLVFSRWGKVASASTVTTLIEKFGADIVIFTGVAGAASPDLNIGDIVIANSLVQYDMDVSPLSSFSKFDIPLLGKSYLDAERKYVERAMTAAERYISGEFKEETDDETKRKFGITVPKIVEGTIASGDRFVAEAQKIKELSSEIMNLKCVEMEGAAVAQVCCEHGTPFIVIRVMSDNADESAHVDYSSFINKTARYFTRGIVRRILKDWLA